MLEPPATAWTKVSRFPFGPGRPDDANARIPSPASSIALAAASSASRRSAGSRTTPARARPLPSSNCGLTIASSAPPGARQPAIAGTTLASEMNETSTVASPGR